MAVSFQSTGSWCLRPGSTDPRTSLSLMSRVFVGLKPQSSAAYLDRGMKTSKSGNIPILCAKGLRERIREQLPKIELSASPYDTAWVAMVPFPGSPKVPCFQKCIDWILENQHPDGSWGLPHLHPSFMKDALSSTLACILALKRWNVGEEHVKKGLYFIGSNSSASMDEQLCSPIGFDIIFPGMLECAIDMGIDLPMTQHDIDVMYRKRDLEMKRGPRNNFKGRKAYLAYVAEGLGKLQDWQEVMRYQRANGSLFNSPSTTAAALTHLHDAKALEYLRSLLQKFGSSVPTAYPLDIYIHLRMVDNLERFGIAQHFSQVIKSILDRTYRYWLQNDDEIISDIATLAMAFRLLRMNGYNISSDALTQFSDVNNFYDSLQGHLRDMESVMELYKASQIKILPDEQVLDKLGSWSSDFLKAELLADPKRGLGVIYQEVDYSLKFPFYASLERLEHKRNVEHFSIGNFRILKTSYTSCNIDYKDLLKFAMEEFNISQSTYRKELQCLESWIKENKLDELDFARQKLTYCYLSAAATLYSSDIADARMSWAKNGVLTTVVDDFFDVGGSREELENLIALVEEWDGSHEKEFFSEQVKIVFSALYSTINELGAKASAVQKRNVTRHIVEIWLSLLKSMMIEAEWLRNKSVPTMDQYLTNGYVSFALGPIILPALYFIGPELSEDVIRHPEYQNLYELVSTCGRLLNDIRGLEREGKQGKLNSVALRVLHSGGSISEEEAKKEMLNSINSHRVELLRLVLQNEGSVVPRACKDLFWKMSRILHLFYLKTDGFSSPKEMVSAVNAVIHEPLVVDY